MPRYSYKCKVCGSVSEIFHRMAETVTDCEACSASDSLERIPVLFSVTDTSASNDESTAKQRVDSFISDAKKELGEHQMESRKDYEP